MVLALLGAPAAYAQPAATQRDTVDALVAEAAELARSSDFDGAAERLSLAFSISDDPAVGLELARVYARANKLVAAQTAYRAAATSPRGGAAVETAIGELAAVEARVARAMVSVAGSAAREGGDATVTLDGKPSTAGVWLALDPGTYTFAAKAEGSVPKTSKITLSEGARQVVELKLEPVAVKAPPPAPPPPGYGEDNPPPPPPPSPMPVTEDSSRGTFIALGWTGIAVGGAGLIVGGIFGGLTLQKASEIDAQCTEASVCPESQRAEVQSALNMSLVSTIGLAAGGALAATGVVLLLVAPSDGAGATVGLHAGPAALSLRGSF